MSVSEKSKGKGTNGKKKSVKEIAKGRTAHQYFKVSIIVDKKKKCN
jgi:hypothetical protein